MNTVRPERWKELYGLTEDEVQGERVSEEVQVRVKKNPVLPSEKQVEEHYASNHVLFRSWCKACIMGKGVNSAHFKSNKEEEQEVSTVSVDYGFMTNDDEKDSEAGYMPIVVMVDRNTGKLNANVVPSEGVNPYAVKRVAQNIRLLGYSKLVLKCDQEPAMVALRDAVKRELETVVVPEESPVGESQSNGEVEGAIKLIKAQIRTMRLALQSRYKTVIEESDDIVAWMVAEAAESINRYQIGADGKTRRQRVTGKNWLGQVAEFGECVYYLKLKTKGIHTWEERWAEGIWLGIREESGELIICTSEGVVEARHGQRKPRKQKDGMLTS